MDVYLALVVCLSFLLNHCHGVSFVATPASIEMCGSQQTNSLKLSCRPTVGGIQQVFAIEIGKMSGSSKSVISRVTVVDPFTVTDIDTALASRLGHSGSISGRTGSLDLTLSSLVDSDATTYYCYISYMTTEIGEEHTTRDVIIHSLKGLVPSCNGTDVEHSLVTHTPVLASNAGKCPNGIPGRSEALLMQFCAGPDIARWGAGKKVMETCCQIPLYTPIATFEFGLYVQDERGMSGVFLGCTDKGFEMATQLCGHPPIKVPLTSSGSSGYISDADNYYVVEFDGHHNPFG